MPRDGCLDTSTHTCKTSQESRPSTSTTARKTDSRASGALSTTSKDCPGFPPGAHHSSEVFYQFDVAGTGEFEGTAERLFFGAGDRAYEYLIELPDGDILLVSTTTHADGDYEEHRDVLDAMMETLELSGS